VSGRQFTLTVSFSVSDPSICGHEFTELYAGADRALYQAKDCGRNKVLHYQIIYYVFAKESVVQVN
jgi:PleD family two-component response regulator